MSGNRPDFEDRLQVKRQKVAFAPDSEDEDDGGVPLGNSFKRPAQEKIEVSNFLRSTLDDPALWRTQNTSTRSTYLRSSANCTLLSRLSVIGVRGSY